QPLYVSGLNIPGQGTHNVVFVATEHNDVYAFDADSNSGANGGLLWHVNLGPSAATPSPDFGTRYGAYGALVPEVGITGTPVIDSGSGTLYVDAFTHEGTNYFHKIHALNITNGMERPFSHVVVSASIPGTGVEGANGVVTFEAKQQIQRGALTLAGGILYVTYAGYDDTNPYHGWIIGFAATNLEQLPNYIFNTTPNSPISDYGADAGEAGIWMGGGGLAVDENTNLYFTTGNGSFNAFNGFNGTEFGDSFIKLSTDGGLSVADYFTPYNQAYYAENDLDVGSGGVVLLPDQSGEFPHLMIGGGKPGFGYLMNRDMMTAGNNHYNSGSAMDAVLQTFSLNGGIFSTPAYFNHRIYFAASGDKLLAFSLSNGALSAAPVSIGPRTFGFPGATPSISANGNNNGIVWAIQRANPAVLTAYNATNLTSEIYSSAQASGARDQLPEGVKFAVPTVANGKVYVGTKGGLYVFGLLGGAIQFSAANYTAPDTNGTVTITVNRSGGSIGGAQVSYSTVNGGTAIEGVDYDAASGILNWTNGDNSPKNFDLTILGGAPSGENKTIDLALNNALGAILGTPSTAIVTIMESSYSLWKFDHFGTNADNPDIAGNLADPDNDKIPNILEYAFASDPNAFTPGSAISGAVANNHFQLTFNRNSSATDLTYVLQATTSFTNAWKSLMTYTSYSGWTTNAPGINVSESAAVGSPPDQSVRVTLTDPTDLQNAEPIRFFRLQVWH
ncbi:MAG TPA: Calx-beta domain-containing protein, partial [Verrucomicrobiae bacterium]|nr:Calx-beta domain-containing protein [Verrucomicrobiae bacterium]